ncbi:MAG: hypothetical protein WAT66_02485 [Actinomycetota bacterium]
MDQAAQIVGALFILGAFFLAQRKKLATTSRTYLALNLVGAAVLAVVAAADRDWGFLLLEGMWALISAWGLVGARAAG